MRLTLLATAVVLASTAHLDLADSTGSSGICPLVGPVPPARCDGRDRTWFPVSVVGSGTFCTLGPEVCVADQLAACPGSSDQLPYGSKCVQFASNVYGCVPKTTCEDGVLDERLSDSLKADPTCERACQIDRTIPVQCDGSSGWTPVSVVGSISFCVKGPICSGNAHGSCPEPQHGLPFGASCLRIPTGVFGCVKNTRCQNGCSGTPPSFGQGSNDNTANDTVVSTQTPTLTPAAITPAAAPLPQSTDTTPAPTTTPAVVTLPLASPELPDDNNEPGDHVDGDDNVSLLPVLSLEELIPIETVEIV